MKKILQVVILLVAFSCTKEPTSGITNVEGTVQSYFNNEPVPFAEVVLREDNINNTGALGLKEIERKTCDANGRFSFEFNAKENCFYTVKASAQHYFDTDHAKSLKNGQKNLNYIVPINPKGYIKFIIQNEEPKEYINEIVIGSIVMTNLKHDTTVYVGRIGGKNITLNWFIFDKYGVKTSYEDNILINPLDTVDYFIKY